MDLSKTKLLYKNNFEIGYLFRERSEFFYLIYRLLRNWKAWEENPSFYKLGQAKRLTKSLNTCENINGSGKFLWLDVSLIW